jgi:anti-sigma factor RsiW
MKCGEIRGLLAADYIDGELDEGARGEVERHLGACPRCRQFEEAVRRDAINPFRDAQLTAAPASLWHRVRQGIEQERSGGLGAVLRGWLCMFRIWEAAAAAASLAVVILVAMFLLHAPPTATRGTRVPSADTEELQAYLQEQLSSLAYHGNNGSGESSNGETANGSSSANFGTLVEEYLM